MMRNHDQRQPPRIMRLMQMHNMHLHKH